MQHAVIIDLEARTGHQHRGAAEAAVTDDEVGSAGQQQQRLPGGIGGADRIRAGLPRARHDETTGWTTQPQGGERGKVDSITRGARRRGALHGRPR
jgi:hypothetical protein